VTLLRIHGFLIHLIGLRAGFDRTR
jgi:hypothetical protein